MPIKNFNSVAIRSDSITLLQTSFVSANMNLKVFNLKYETNLFHDEQHRKQSNYNIFIRPTTYYKKSQN